MIMGIIPAITIAQDSNSPKKSSLEVTKGVLVLPDVAQFVLWHH